MKKKFWLVLFCLVALVGKVFAEDPCIVTYSIGPYHGTPNYYTEYLFDDDGMLKKINIYEYEGFLELKNWAKIKKTLPLASYYDVVKAGDDIVKYYYCQKKIEEVVRLNIKTLSEVPDQVTNPFTGGILTADSFSIKNFEEDFLISYNKEKDVYEEIRPDNVDDFEYILKTIYYVSDYIHFSPLARKINFAIENQNYYGVFFFTDPTKPITKFNYSSGENSCVSTKSSFSLQTPELNITNKNTYWTFDSYPFVKTAKGKNLAMVLRSYEMGVVYTEKSKAPVMTGFAENQNLELVNIKSIKASSSLKEKDIVYGPENLLKMELDAPWVEGKEGDGIDEYLEVKISDATGFYILNGFLSWDKPALFKNNNRVKKIEVRGMKSGKVLNLELQDMPDPQFVSLEGFKKNESVRIIIKDVYKGKKYSDTCIGGLIFVKEKKL